MKIDLTVRQTRQLRRHFDAVRNAYENNGMTRASMLVAQIHEPDSFHSNGITGSMRVGFVAKEHAKQLIIEASYRMLCPLGFGIPAGWPRTTVSATGGSDG